MSDKHIMIDLETWGTGAYAMIVSIGAVWFDPNREEVLDRFLVAIDPVDAGKRGFRIDASTINWWMDPDQRPALTYLRALPKTPVHEALTGFSMWLDQLDRGDPVGPGVASEKDGRTIRHRKLWGNGSTFDNVLLRQAYELMGIEAPWKYTGDMCFRTLKSLPRANTVRPPFSGIQHAADDDAVHQARWLMRIFKEYGLTV